MVPTDPYSQSGAINGTTGFVYSRFQMRRIRLKTTISLICSVKLARTEDLLLQPRENSVFRAAELNYVNGIFDYEILQKRIRVWQTSTNSQTK